MVERVQEMEAKKRYGLDIRGRRGRRWAGRDDTHLSRPSELAVASSFSRWASVTLQDVHT